MFFNDTATTEIYTLSLHDALPICRRLEHRACLRRRGLLVPILELRGGPGGRGLEERRRMDVGGGGRRGAEAPQGGAPEGDSDPAGQLTRHPSIPRDTGTSRDHADGNTNGNGPGHPRLRAVLLEDGFGTES